MSHGHEKKTLRLDEVTIPRNHWWNTFMVAGAVAGVAGIGATFALGAADHHQLYYSYLTSFMYFLTLALGGMFFVLIQYAARAGWSVVVRRIAENMMATVPVFAVLFIPVVLGMHDLFHWTHAEAMEDPILKGKESYLNQEFFLIRAGIYFAVWIGVALYFYRSSTSQDTTKDLQTTRRLQAISAPAIALFALSITFAGFDWMMSLDPHWFSTIFGVYTFAGSVVATFAFLAVFSVMMRRAGLLGGVVTTEHLHDLGKLVFAFTVFWTYIAFSQYFLIWYANMPEETIFYRHRWENSWANISAFLALGHFVIPFFFLLPRTIKRNATTLVIGSLWMLFMHFVDLYWVIMPNHHKHGVHFSVIDVTAFVGVGGVFLASFAYLTKRHATVPLGDPRLPESVAFENF
ncbi:MAG: hypothetical protein HUU55_13515 [Myxococcales bacterium]|nr:hypothetical protein [Myxococcales bacterium]